MTYINYENQTALLLDKLTDYILKLKYVSRFEKYKENPLPSEDDNYKTETDNITAIMKRLNIYFNCAIIIFVISMALIPMYFVLKSIV